MLVFRLLVPVVTYSQDWLGPEIWTPRTEGLSGKYADHSWK